MKVRAIEEGVYVALGNRNGSATINRGTSPA